MHNNLLSCWCSKTSEKFNCLSLRPQVQSSAVKEKKKKKKKKVFKPTFLVRL